MTTPLPSERSFQDLLRYPLEQRTLWLTAINLALFAALLSIFSLGTALLVGVFILFTIGLLVRVNHRRQVGSAVRIGANQFPELAHQAELTAQAVRVPPVQVFIHQDEEINAYSFGWGYPQAVVLTSAAVDAMDAAEFRFLLGHEMGHIALGHTRLGTLVGGIFGVPSVALLSNLVLPAFYWWKRCAEYSADRAGLVACGDLNKALTAMVKIMVGKHLASQVNLEELRAQADELSRRVDALAGELGSTHPYLVNRVRQLANYWQSPECQMLIFQKED